jgi:hypothetical protein
MTTAQIIFTLREMECVVDALALLCRDENEMRKMGHRVSDVTELRARIRRVMAEYPEVEG